MIRPRKRMWGGKEDRRFVYRETSRGLNEGGYYGKETKGGRQKWVIHVVRLQEAAPGVTLAGY